MTVAFNPSRIMNDLEYNLHKGVSRARTDNQNQIEACIAETDKITEQKSDAYRREAMFMVAFAVGMVAFAIIGAVVELRLESFQSELNDLQCRPRPLFELEATRIETLNSGLKHCKLGKLFFNTTTSQAFDRGSNIYSSFSRISMNQYDHQYKKQDMRWSQLNQARSNSPEESTLSDVKQMRRQHQRTKEAAG